MRHSKILSKIARQLICSCKKVLIFAYIYTIMNMHLKRSALIKDALLAQLDRALDYGSKG